MPLVVAKSQRVALQTCFGGRVVSASDYLWSSLEND